MNTASNLILGFDPGLNVTGWGAIKSYGNREEHISHGTIVTKNQQILGVRLNNIFEQVSDLCRKYSPSSIAVEKIFSNKNPDSTIKLGKARGIIFLVAARYDIEIFEYSPNTVKKNLVGYGHAEKSQIIYIFQSPLNQ